MFQFVRYWTCDAQTMRVDRRYESSWGGVRSEASMSVARELQSFATHPTPIAGILESYGLPPSVVDRYNENQRPDEDGTMVQTGSSIQPERYVVRRRFLHIRRRIWLK